MSTLARADSSVALSPPDLAVEDVNIVDTGKSPGAVGSFIDKGNIQLPVAPEIAEKGPTKIPSQILDNPVIDVAPPKAIVEPQTPIPAPAAISAPVEVETPYVAPKSLPDALPSTPTVPSKETITPPIAPVEITKGVVETEHQSDASLPDIEKSTSDLSLPELPAIDEKEDKNIAVDKAVPKNKYSITIPLPKIVTDLFPKRPPEVDKPNNEALVADQKAIEEEADLEEEYQFAPQEVYVFPVPIADPVMQKEEVLENLPAPVVVAESVPIPAPVLVPAVVPVIQKELIVEKEAPLAIVEPKKEAPAPVIQKEEVAASPVVTSTSDEKKVETSKFLPNVRRNKAVQSPAKVKTISKNIPISPKGTENILPKPLDPEVEKFVQNEVQMLYLPDDEVVLGSITNDARFDYIGYSQYFSIYQKYREYVKRLNQLDETISFIDSRRQINGNDIPMLSEGALFTTAVNKIQYNKIDDLRALVDNYKLINLVDRKGNSLLHVAAFADNVAVTKWLIMRGSNVNAMNNDSTSPRDIAEYKQYWGVFNLLEAANAQ